MPVMESEASKGSAAVPKPRSGGAASADEATCEQTAGRTSARLLRHCAVLIGPQLSRAAAPRRRFPSRTASVRVRTRCGRSAKRALVALRSQQAGPVPDVPPDAGRCADALAEPGPPRPHSPAADRPRCTELRGRSAAAARRQHDMAPLIARRSRPDLAPPPPPARRTRGRPQAGFSLAAPSPAFLPSDFARGRSAPSSLWFLRRHVVASSPPPAAVASRCFHRRARSPPAALHAHLLR